MEGKQAIFAIVGVLILLVIFGSIDLIAQELGWIENLSGTIAQYVFGFDTITLGGSGAISDYALIVTFMMLWLIIFVTFGDIFESFASFSPTIAWIIAFAFALIAGLTGMINGIVLQGTNYLVWAGTASVYLALLLAFFVFLAVNFGLTPLIGWIKKRREMQDIVRGEINARKTAEGAKNLRTIQEDAFEKDGSGI